VRHAVLKRFGADVAPNATIDRAVVAQRAFATPEDRAWLEGLLWPLVGGRVLDWRQELGRRSPAPRAGVVEVPLLFEAGMEPVFDATIAVIAEETLREERAGARGHEALDERLARQLTQQEKAQRATYTVVNDGTFDDLEHELLAVLDKLAT
jgi:dephospho-CoA kinase